uniref:Ubiquitin conjugating enzyme 12 n=1 Tax=Ciliophrys infusionum TaxID=38824 RepID=X5IGK1_9STRA|nr:ubiquitin conjugating enzyme 12 [Ciliophrys infusionum]
MLRLKNKKAQEQKQQEEQKAAESKAATNGAAAEEHGPISVVDGIGGEAVNTGKKKKKRTPGEIRIQKDIAELDGGTVARHEFPSNSDLTKFFVIITPDSGFWRGATYRFSFTIPAQYPHEAPKVLCLTRIYHPNINLEGNVCLNILREDWKPVLDINAVIYGLIYLFYEPNPDDPLNHEAADLFRTNIASFERTVQRTLRGGSHQGVMFERLL